MTTDVMPAPGWFRWRRWGEGPASVTGGAGAASVFTGRQRLALLAGFALLIVLRLPHAWTHGRFLDEEGTIFFAYAWHRPAGDALWRSFGGYLNLAANATTLMAARLVRGGALPLERAPYVTMAAALLFQLVPAALVLTGRARWLANRWAVVAALLLLVTAPMTEEVFVNVLHIQFHLAMAAALILALDLPASRVGRLAYGAVLLLAPLCGPGAIILLPFFAARALVDRDRARLAQVAVFAAATALQLLVFFTPSPVRGHLLDPATLAAVMLVRLVVLPLTSEAPANALGTAIHHAWLAPSPWWWPAPVAALAGFAALIREGLRERDAATWLIVPALTVAALSFGGGMINSDPREWFSVGAGERYNLLPLVLLAMALIVLARRRTGRRRRLWVGLCLLALLSGAITFASPIPETRDGPVWPDEVAAWRRNHGHPLAAWPSAWTVDLSDRDRACSPPRPGRTTTDPSYCESAWLARVMRATALDAKRR